MKIVSPFVSIGRTGVTKARIAAETALRLSGKKIALIAADQNAHRLL